MSGSAAKLAPALSRDRRPPWGLIALIAVQVFCAAFFAGDVLNDFREAGVQQAILGHLDIEALATLSLIAAIVVETRMAVRILRRQAHLERSVSVASAAMNDVIQAHFAAWNLTASEADIANFLVKGLSIAEIARLRGSAEGTVKSHLNAIYRKSGTANRGELLSLILESLMG
ncbi:helix-turn-helix transcriptional regulator [Oceaniglobus roseus]|uniref:helix-turn-helix transcriptional regulator n=1 Tax=Oceaniglobus roseus TaxID=1737570 RepID=UPI001FEA7CF4|nr:helix-turn-helix transcriptional regulator [Kandeliimicrobium roseum]